MDHVRTDILEIAFEQGGPATGKPVLLLHGWPDAPRGWNQVARALQQRLAHHHAVSSRFESNALPFD